MNTRTAIGSRQDMHEIAGPQPAAAGRRFHTGSVWRKSVYWLAIALAGAVAALAPASSASAAPPPVTPQALYRLMENSSAQHFYTTDWSEAVRAMNSGWTYEGVRAHVEPVLHCGTVCLTTPSGTTFFYRQYQPSSGDHFYTTDALEVRQASNNGYNFERYQAAVWTAAGQQSGTVPFYRLYNGGIADHFYTTSIDEVNTAISNGYQYEGIAAYVLP